MAEVSKSASRSVFVRSVPPYQGSMTVWALRDFVHTLDAEGVPDSTTLSVERNHSTLHLTGLWVRVTTPIEGDDE